MYGVANWKIVEDWLQNESDPEERVRLLEWCASFFEAPRRYAIPVPGIDGPAFIAIIPVRNGVVLRFLLAEDFRKVRLIAIEALP